MEHLLTVAVDADVSGHTEGGKAEEQRERVEDSDEGVVYAEHFPTMCVEKYVSRERSVTVLLGERKRELRVVTVLSFGRELAIVFYPSF